MARKSAQVRPTLRGRETFYGNVENTEDALRIIGACAKGLLRRAKTRLGAEECVAVRPGSVFVFDEEESGIKRWTDGKVWSPSRIVGNWLVYRELERKIGRRAGGGPNCSGVPNELKNSGLQVIGSTKGTFIVKGSGGLIKKTFSVPNGSSTTHLVIYLPNEHSPPHDLPRPSEFPDLANVHVQQGSAQAQRFRRRKTSPSSSPSRGGKRNNSHNKRSRTGKHKRPQRRLSDEEVSAVEFDGDAPPVYKRRPTLRPVPARTERKRDFYRVDDTSSETSGGSVYVASDDEDGAARPVVAGPFRVCGEASPEFAERPEPAGLRIPVGRAALKKPRSPFPAGARADGDRLSCDEDEEAEEDGGRFPGNRRGGAGNASARAEISSGEVSSPAADLGGPERAPLGPPDLPLLPNPRSPAGSIASRSPGMPASPTLLSLAADPYYYDDENDFEDALFDGAASADIGGNEDSSFMVDYMCNRGYSQQLVIPIFEHDLPMLEA